MAGGAVVGGALAEEDAADRRAAAGARQAGLAVGGELFLVAAAFAARQDEMDLAAAERSAEVADPAFQSPYGARITRQKPADPLGASEMTLLPVSQLNAEPTFAQDPVGDKVHCSR